jgi:GNAT superfamily N-acetyltransferase
MVHGSMVGLAIAERQPDGGARLLSFLVEPPWRRRGIGGGMLGRLMLFLQQEGIRPLGVRYQATPLTAMAFEPLLAKLGWSPPRTDFVLCEGLSESLATVDWARRHPIRAPYQVLPWDQLSAEQQHQLTLLEAPAELRPAPASGDIEAAVSLALLHHSAPVGWLLVHRTGSTSVRYSSLYVAPAHRGRARGLALLAAGFRRQHEAGIPLARAAIDSRNGAMLRVLRRHLEPHLSATGSSRSSRAPEALQPWMQQSETGPP